MDNNGDKISSSDITKRVETSCFGPFTRGALLFVR